MASKSVYQNHPSNPAAQGFNVKPRHNLTKKMTRWNPQSSTYWRKSSGASKSE